MKHNGMHILDFRTPALIDNELTFVDAKQFLGRTAIMCFLPYAGLLSGEHLDFEAGRFQEVEATLLIVVSGPRPLHRLWLDQSRKPRTTVLDDPCGRLHRMLGVASTEASPRCHTFVTDRKGMLRLRLTHEFIAGDLEILRRIVGSNYVQTADFGGGREAVPDKRSEYSPV